MNSDLTLYPTMKDSGVPWLGEVPAHWEVLPNRALFAEVKERNHPDEQMLSVTITKGVIPQQNLLADSSKKDSSNIDKSAYKVVWPGDIAYNKMRAWQGAIGVSDYQGIVSPAYIVQRPRDGVYPRYFHYLLRTPAFAKEAERWSYGITSDMWSLRPEHFKMIYGCLPPLPEQAAIVRYLDYMDRRIRKYIRAKQKLIKLLEEQKQVIIHQAVTRGLDPNVHLKPSGIEWLGYVPEHWLRKPLKHWASINRMVLPETTDPDYEFNYLDIGSVGTGYLIRQPVPMKFGDAPSRARRILRKGDTIISTVRTYLKAIYFVSEDDSDLIASTGFAVLTAKPGMVPSFLSMMIQSNTFIDHVTSSSVGIAYSAIAESRLGAFHLVAPPTDSEQMAIVEYINKETRHFFQAIQQLRSEISLLREYRSRLITDVVTGKFDVREVAAKLPEEADEMEEIEEIEADEDGEAILEEGDGPNELQEAEA